jgi:hypothetical protein
MKRATVLLLMCFLVTGTLLAQTPADALKNDNQTLHDRFMLIRTKSQNYQDYKVIKESVLDGLWKIIQDSVNAKQSALRQSKAEVAKLQNDLTSNTAALKAKEDSMQEVVHASTHISVLGIDFEKGFFAGMVGVILLIVALAMAGVLYTMNVLRKNLLEKEELMNSISSEYEDYKRKAMDKQTKLSRELQNERNKLQELGSL